MYRFWDTIIQPVLETLQPRIILEVGSDEGHVFDVEAAAVFFGQGAYLNSPIL